MTRSEKTKLGGFGRRGGVRKEDRSVQKTVGVRRGSIRLDSEGAWWVKAGHPWVYRNTLKHGVGTDFSMREKGLLEAVDSRGKFIGRGYLCSEGAVAMRILSTREAPRHKTGLVENSIVKALALREKLLPKGLSVYRLVHGEGEGLSGFAVDRFARFAVITQYCEEGGFLVEDICKVMAEKTDLEGVYLQKRFRPLSHEKQHSAASLVWGRRADMEEVVHENELKFLVDVRAPVSVGFYCDLREARSLVGRISKNKKVVNCFSHTGSFSVYAAAAGAEEVVSIDISKKYLAWSKKNFRLNELDPDKYEFMALDAVAAMARLAKQGRGPYDIAILDPPTYSAGKKSFVLKNDYPVLMETALKIVKPGGFILACCNTQGVDEEGFQKLIAQGAVRAGRTLKILEKMGMPADFPQPVGFREGSYLKAFFMAAD